MQIQMMPLDAVAPYARNARTHPDWQIAQIAASIAEFGFTNPILVGSDGVIIAGHGRLAAARRLSLAEVPVIVLGHLTEVQRRALVVADNKIAENAGWDEELLAAELAALRADGFDLEVVGFSDSELAEILGGLDEDGAPLPALGDPDHVPETKPRPVSARGDIWCLGDHRVMCGDSTSTAEIATLCADRPVDACWTDPPYNVAYEGSAGSIMNDDMSATDFRRFLFGAFAAAFEVIRPGGPIYVAHADTEGLNFRAAFRDAGFKLSGCLVWVKPSLVLGRSDYQWRHEPILYGWKPGAAHSWYGGRAKTTVFDTPGAPVRVMPDGSLQIEVDGRTLVVTGEGLSVEAVDQSVLRFDKPARNGEHPTMKPVALISEMIENSTRKGDLVLDPFGGSGSTLIACHQHGRVARLMELDEKFVDVIVRRWQEFTGLEAVLLGDGRSFNQMAAQRRAA
jgi:DNA modification methylase